MSGVENCLRCGRETATQYPSQTVKHCFLCHLGILPGQGMAYFDQPRRPGPPHLKNLVSKANPIPWRVWLRRQSRLVHWKGLSQFRLTWQTTYIVHRCRVYTCYGYHGLALWQKLTGEELRRDIYDEAPKIGEAA